MDNIGGFVGRIFIGATLSYNYSRAIFVTGGSVVHAFVGFDDPTPPGATMNNNYWDKSLIPDIDGSPTTRYMGLTTAEMENSVNYTGWDFTNTWRVIVGGAPELINTP